jgi:hypothetical protein
MVETIEINETDSRIQTSCPKFYLELLHETRLGMLLTVSDSALGFQRPVHHVATDEEHRCGRKSRTMNISTDMRWSCTLTRFLVL